MKKETDYVFVREPRAGSRERGGMRALCVLKMIWCKWSFLCRRNVSCLATCRLCLFLGVMYASPPFSNLSAWRCPSIALGQGTSAAGRPPVRVLGGLGRVALRMATDVEGATSPAPSTVAIARSLSVSWAEVCISLVLGAVASTTVWFI